MKCSAFIAMSTDGYIAALDGGVDWLESAGNTATAERKSIWDGGFEAYIETVDCMIMGRKCMEKIASFDLSPQQWPYRDIPIFALSKSLRETPENLVGKVEMFSDGIPALLEKLASAGYEHAYIDGGATITSFTRHGLLNEICVTQVPLLLGEGIPLFGSIGRSVALSAARATVFSNDFIQWRYQISYA